MFAESIMSGWLHRRQRAPAGPTARAPATVDDIRQRALLALQGCAGPTCERLQARLRAARTASELWALRSDIFELVARQHCQALAAERVNELLPIFEGWVPPRQLAPI